MGRISQSFSSVRERREMALVCYLTAGYPDRVGCIEYTMACLEGGADIIEVGIPYSDPVADGPVIQATSDAALRGGMRPKGVLDLVAELRSRTGTVISLGPISYHADHCITIMNHELDLRGPPSGKGPS